MENRFRSKLKDILVTQNVDSENISPYWNIPTHVTKLERLLLLELSSQVKDNSVIVEIGSYLGASTCFLAAGSHRRTRRVYAVDTWQNHAMTEGTQDTYHRFLENIAPFEGIVVPLRGFSTEVAQDFSENIDLLFLDGDHSYGGLKKDLEVWLPKIKKNGIIVFHDYGWSEGIQKAVREIIFPIQIDGGRCVDSIYWARVDTTINVLKENTPVISVIIPTLNRSSHAIEALKSVVEQETALSYEVIVVDNGCDLSLARDADAIKHASSVPVIYKALSELGLHNGRNVGALLAKGQIVVYIDDDVIVPPDWLNKIYTPFEDPEVGAVAGRSLPKWEGPQPEWLSQIDTSYLSLLDLGDEVRQLQWPQTPFGCNMAFRRNLVLGLRGFHPDGTAETGIQWHRGDGETGFTKKVYEAGYKVIYSGQAWLYHRIPSHRLESKSLESRAAKSAISSFYTDIRTYRYRRWQLPLLATLSFAKFVRAALYADIFLRIVDPARRIRAKLSKTYYWTATLYQLRLAVDGSLRSWVFRPDYWLTSDRLSEIFTGSNR